MTYAANTTVSVDKSRAEIEGTLRRYGASMFFSGWDDDKTFVAFKLNDRHVRLTLPLPSKNEERFKKRKIANSTWQYKTLTPQQSQEAYEQELRTRFRALLLCLKAKLESVEAKIETFDQAFLAHVVLPDDSLVGDRVKALLEEAYRTGSMKNLLPAQGESETE